MADDRLLLPPPDAARILSGSERRQDDARVRGRDLVPMSATVRTKPDGYLSLTDRGRRFTQSRTPAQGDPTRRHPRSRPIDGAFPGADELHSRTPLVAGQRAMAPDTGVAGGSTDRLVAALAIMIQQADNNRHDGAGTLPASSDLRIT